MSAKLLRDETLSGTEEQIRAELSGMFAAMRRKSRTEKKRVLFLVDNSNWCWTTTARNIAKHIPEYHFQIERCDQWKRFHKSMLEMCDIVYMRGYPFTFLDGLPEIDKPYIWTLSTGGENLAMRIEQSLPYAERAAACVVQCERSRREAAAAGVNNLCVIPNGVDVEMFRPRIPGEDAKADVGFAGNNEGARENLKGCRYVRGACESGGFSYVEVTKKNRLTYSDMPGFYRSIKIYAQPSDSEGCSNSVMEAMSCGIPCLICEGVGYHGETCKGGEVVFVERDDKDIERNIRRLLSDGEYYARVSAAARSFAMRHSWPEMANRHRALIDSALASCVAPAVESVARHVAGHCNTCAYYFALKDCKDCGLCMEDNAALTMRHKRMTCSKHRGKG